MLSQSVFSRFGPRFAVSLGFLLGICILDLAASAQEGRTVSFDAPGADTTAGDFNGTYPSGINAWGTIAGAYQSADTVLHGFVRSRAGKFSRFQAPGADTTPGSYHGTYPNSINDLGVVTGYYADAKWGQPRLRPQRRREIHDL